MSLMHFLLFPFGALFSSNGSLFTLPLIEVAVLLVWLLLDYKLIGRERILRRAEKSKLAVFAKVYH